MKTRDQIYGQEAARLLRDVTMYRALTKPQLLALYPGKKEKIAALLNHRVRQGRIFYDKMCIRDRVWSLELSVQQVRSKFQIEYGSSIEDFLESIYLAGADLSGSEIEHHARCIERSHKMLKLMEAALELLRAKHKNGESYYWILYYSFLSPQQMRNVEEIIEKLRPHIRDISYRTYYRRRKEAIDAFSSILWGYTSADSFKILEQFYPDKEIGM